MMDAALIREATSAPTSTTYDERRIYHRLTATRTQAVEAELDGYREVVAVATPTRRTPNAFARASDHATGCRR